MADPIVDQAAMSASLEQPELSVSTHVPHESAPAPVESKDKGAKGKRFSLDAFRVPFLASSRKPSGAAQFLSSKVADAEQSAPGSEALETESHALKQDAADKHLAPPQELQPKRSALSRRASKNMSPHRVSFSPSTEEVAEAREQALVSSTYPDEPLDRPTTKTIGVGQSPMQRKGSKVKQNLAKLRGLKSRSTPDLASPSRKVSTDSTRTVSSVASSSASEVFEDRAALQGIGAAKRRLFRWDRKGIHRSNPKEGDGKATAAKAKVTKHQAVAARHAKTLEQVINAGMGLHPISARTSSVPEQAKKDGNKTKKPLRAKTIPMVDRSQLKGLKSALLDVDLANNIISELRAMPVPLDSLQSGLGTMLPGTLIGTAGEHGQERIISTNLPDRALQGPISKDDSEIRKRREAAADLMDSSTERPKAPRAKSAAEEALKRIGKQADAAAASQKAVVSARTSSLPPPVEENATKDAGSGQAVLPSPAPQGPVRQAADKKIAAKPLKMVCLDCSEEEAHRRHAQHLDAVAVVVSPGSQPSSIASPPSDAESGAANKVNLIATGAAAALAGVGGLFGTPAATSDPASSDNEKQQDTSSRPPLLKSISVANLPTLADGQRLMGSTPLQLLMDPVGTAAQSSGAFKALANVSGAAIRATQDMDSIHPPLDRMAIFVHWWGFEITLPKLSMAYLDTAHSVSGAFLSFLQTMAVGGGVPELLPFIKYISTFMEVEYKAIQAQDRGHGVCIAGTWFMPLALVPRPWDYPLDGIAPSTPGSDTKQPSPPPFVPVSSPAAPMESPSPLPIPTMPESTDAAAPPKRHAFKKKASTDSTDAATAQVAAVQEPVPSKRNLTPTQLAAIQAAKVESIAHDLSPRHSRSSSVASAQVTKDLTEAFTGGAALTSVQEIPEVGSVRVKVQA